MFNDILLDSLISPRQKLVWPLLSDTIPDAGLVEEAPQSSWRQDKEAQSRAVSKTEFITVFWQSSGEGLGLFSKGGEKASLFISAITQQTRCRASFLMLTPQGWLSCARTSRVSFTVLPS